MSDVAIQVEGLSKLYRLGQEISYGTLWKGFTSAMHAALHRFRGNSNPGFGNADSEYFWALKDISFQVRQGEILGIIGRNGAGKSTLLKILSRITEPTSGRAKIRGRVRSLLEVGTGFHPELTGRENVYLNGAILGMKRSEVERKFDEIVAFSEVEQFLDTPVKRYSSGMSVRLAFAVAAHLEPDVLLVDEVLAVGDWEFQKKCLGRMGDVSKMGRTVLLVSHNMTSIHTLCQRAILLDHGKIASDDSASNAIRLYIGYGRHSNAEVVWNDPENAPGNDRVRLHAVRILSKDGKATVELDIAEDILIQILFWNLRPGGKLFQNIHIKDQMGNFVLACANLPSTSLTPDPWSGKPLPAGLFQTVCRIPGNLLNASSYVLDAIVSEQVGRYGGAYAEGVITFHVFDSGAMRKENFVGKWPGAVRVRLGWQTEHLGALDSSSPFAGGAKGGV